MESKIKGNKWEIKSKSYYARVKIKKTEKDGEYYDVVFGLKGHKNREMRTHYGIKAVAENGLIGGKVFFVEPRKATLGYREKTYNSKTGELLSKSDIPFTENEDKVGAELHYGTVWDDVEKKLFLKKFEIIEFDEPR